MASASTLAGPFYKTERPIRALLFKKAFVNYTRFHKVCQKFVKSKTPKGVQATAKQARLTNLERHS